MPAATLKGHDGKLFMEKHEGFMRALKCRECGREYPLTATHVCEFDFGPLEVAYDYDRIRKSLESKTKPRGKGLQQEGPKWIFAALPDPVATARGSDTPSLRLGQGNFHRH